MFQVATSSRLRDNAIPVSLTFEKGWNGLNSCKSIFFKMEDRLRTLQIHDMPLNFSEVKERPCVDKCRDMPELLHARRVVR